MGAAGVVEHGGGEVTRRGVGERSAETGQAKRLAHADADRSPAGPQGAHVGNDGHMTALSRLPSGVSGSQSIGFVRYEGASRCLVVLLESCHAWPPVLRWPWPRWASPPSRLVPGVGGAARVAGRR